MIVSINNKIDMNKINILYNNEMYIMIKNHETLEETYERGWFIIKL